MLILISSYHFNISAPYTEGHRITQAEADVLNAARADGITRKAERVFRKWDKARAAGAVGILPPEEQALFARRVAEIDRDFELTDREGNISLGIAGSSEKFKPGTFQAELRLCSLKALEERELAQGIKLTDAQRITFLREVERDPAHQSLAARRLEEKKKVSADAVLRLMGTPEEMF